jgi:hypothetical protein
MVNLGVHSRLDATVLTTETSTAWPMTLTSSTRRSA